jgi:hypothetical protein
MARTSWLDEETDLPNLDDRLRSLEHFTNALADGVIEQRELDTQQQAVIAVMREVEASLDDATHEKVTRLLLELTALNVMTVLHDLAAERVRATFASPASTP